MIRACLVALALMWGLTAPASCGGNELMTLNLGDSASYWGPVLIHYVPALTTIINEPIANYSGTEVIRVAKLRLSARSSDTLIIDYSEGASADPCFIIHRIEKDGPRRLGNPIMGLELEAPGNGFFYVRGHTDSWFDMRRKFTVENGNLREVKQPFYYVGLETRTLAQIHIFSTQGGGESIGWIEKGAPVTVILNDGYSFLLKTDHDVLGWWRPQNMSQQRAEEIEGIFFRGD